MTRSPSTSTPSDSHQNLPSAPRGGGPPTDIPSDAEAREKGVNLGALQAKLLAKIEELTLHMIQQEKEDQDLRGRIARLETTTAPAATPEAVK